MTDDDEDDVFRHDFVKNLKKCICFDGDADGDDDDEDDDDDDR